MSSRVSFVTLSVFTTFESQVNQITLIDTVPKVVCSISTNVISTKLVPGFQDLIEVTPYQSATLKNKICVYQVIPELYPIAEGVASIDDTKKKNLGGESTLTMT